jgi:hypothetical protein
MKKMNLLALSLVIIVTAIYCMEEDQAGEGQETLTLEQLTLGENEQEQPQRPARNVAPVRVPLQHIGGTLPPYSPVGSRSNSPYSPSGQFTRMRPIGQSPATVPAVAPVAQNIAPVTPNIAPVGQNVVAVRETNTPNTPNAAMTTAAEEALNALDRGDTARARAALERIRAFLPPRSGRSSENRNPENPN